MAEYIEREAVLGMLPTDCIMRDLYAMGHNTCKRTIQRAIKAIPTADVVEVRRGEWVHKNNEMYCSVCGDEALMDEVYYESPYCPNCGAKMDGKGEGE